MRMEIGKDKRIMPELRQPNNTLSSYWAMGLMLIIPLSMYTLGITTVTLSEWILLFGSFLFILYRKGKVCIDKNIKGFLFFMLLFFLLTMLDHFIQMRFQSRVIIRNIRVFLCVMYIVVAYNAVTWKTLNRLIRIFAMIASFYIIIQFLAYSLAKVYLPSHLLPLPTSREEDIALNSLLYSKYYFRGSGFFAEPSYAIKFLLPCFVYSLFGWTDEKNTIDYKRALIIAAAILCTTSMQGIVCMVIVVIIRMMSFLSDHKVSVRRVILSMGLALGALLLFYLFSRQQGYTLISNRFATVYLGTFNKGGSASLRLFRGYYVFGEFPFVQKIAGIGYGGLTEYIKTNGITTIHDSIYTTDSAIGYVNGISMVLCSVGIVGFAFFVYFIVRLFKNSTRISRLILLSYIIMLLSGGGVFDLLMVYYLSIVFIENKRKNGQTLVSDVDLSDSRIVS